MAREKELYRDNLMRLKEIFGDNEFLTLKQASGYLRVDSRTLKNDKNFPTKKIGRMYYVPIVAFASWLS